jgi:glycosyltransferase involved in cell wall biosynthesis
MPKISVVVPTMNEEKYLKPCLESLQAQTYKDYEVVAIDKSTDSTPALCRQYGWRVVTQQSKGIAKARKEGFAATTGEIICCTDADTKVDVKWLEIMERSFRDPKVGAIYGPVFLLDGPLWLRIAGNIFYTLFLWIGELTGKPNLAGMNFAVRKSAYDAVGGFREDLTTAEDVDLGLRIKKSGAGKVKYVAGLKVYTSARRLMAYGVLKFLAHHIANYLRIIFKGKASDNFEPIR